MLFRSTLAGKAVLAASMNPRGVTLLGIELSTIYVGVWAIYGALAGVAGVLLGMFSLGTALVVLVQYLFNFEIAGYNPRDQRGWTSLMLAVLFLSSAQLFCLGIIGEYVGRLFDEVKKRPVYLVGKTVNIDAACGLADAKPQAARVNDTG